MFNTNYRAGDAGKFAEPLTEMFLTCDFGPVISEQMFDRVKSPC